MWTRVRLTANEITLKRDRSFLYYRIQCTARLLQPKLWFGYHTHIWDGPTTFILLNYLHSVLIYTHILYRRKKPIILHKLAFYNYVEL